MTPNAPALELLPAVDVQDGQAVRLVQGEAGSATSYGDPVTAALEDPDWTARVIERFGDRVAVGLDVRGTTLAARGWTKEGGDLWEVLARLEDAGCARYVVTDVTKDGTLKGPNTELLAQVCAKTAKPVVASGGISSLEDVAALAAMTGQGVEGAIMGKALYAGRFSLEQALAVAGGATVEQARSEQPGPVAP